MPNFDENTKVWCTLKQLKENWGDPIRSDPLHKDQTFTPGEAKDAMLEIVGRTVGNSNAIIRMAVEDIPYNYFVCEKNLLAYVKNKATQVTDEVRQYTRIAKLSDTKVLLGWLIDGKVYLKMFVYNLNNNTWSPSSLVHQVHGRVNLKVRHFDLIGMSDKVAILGLIPEGDSSTQHLLRISVLGDSIYEQGESTTLSKQFADYISLCRLTNTKFMCALWGFDYFDSNTNQIDPYRGQTFVLELEMYPFIASGNAKQEFTVTKVAHYGERAFLTGTKKTPYALTMMAVDENSIILARLANYEQYVITEKICPHSTQPYVLITPEAFWHQDAIHDATKICSTLLLPDFIVSCVTAQNKVFCVVDKLATRERVLKTAILNSAPDNIAVKNIGQNNFVFLATWADANNRNSQLIKFRYNEVNNSIIELGKVENLQLGNAALEALTYDNAVLCGNRTYGENAVKLTIQPCSISSGVAVAHRNDEIIGISDVAAKAGDNVVISGLAERYPNDD